MNLLISFHSIFQDEESLGREEEVEHVGQEEDLEVGGWRKPLTEDNTLTRMTKRSTRRRRARGGCRAGRRGGGVMGLDQDPHPHTDLGGATSFTLLWCLMKTSSCYHPLWRQVSLSYFCVLF
jgi:hypothetical protein